MPTSQEVWDSYKPRIYELYFNQKLPLREVIRIMKTEGLDATRATYHRKFILWGDALQKKSVYLQDIQLITLVKRLYKDNLSHREILRVLQDFEGYPSLQDWQLKRIRLDANLVYQNRNISLETLQQATAIIQSGFESSLITQWGYRSVQTYLRVHHDLFLSRRAVSSILRSIDPIAVASRGFEAPRRRKRYMVKGPNRIWSIDGHDKLSAYGFQIYGIIDAYSRKVLGLFVGLSNRTQISVLRFYLRTVQEFGVPKAVRADKGKETGLAAAAHLAFRRARKPSISITKVWAYGTSTKNQRIERFWRSLVDQQTDQWIAYFTTLNHNGLFDGSKFDVIALTFLYMDHLREQLGQYIRTYNTRAIRKQVSREFYLPAGKPNYMFRYPPTGVRNYASPPDPELLKEFNKSLNWYDDQAYLTVKTREICEEIVRDSGIAYDISQISPGLEQPHTQVYKILRARLSEWEIAGEMIEELEPPLGSIRTIEKNHAEFKSAVNHQQYPTPANLAGEFELPSDSDSTWDSENESDDREGFFELDNTEFI